MPYIKKQDRKKFDDAIEEIVDELIDHRFKHFNVGELNYILSSIIWKLFKENPSYKTGNDLMGVISGVDKEFYRRVLAPYEDEKIKENGDI